MHEFEEHFADSLRGAGWKILGPGPAVGQERAIDRFDLAPRFVRGPAIIHHVVGQAGLLFERHLAPNPLPGLCFTQTIACHQTLDVRRLVHVDDDYAVHTVGRADFDEEGGVLNDDPVKSLIKLVRFPQPDYFQVLRTKLKWGER